jgi:GAF domain-containing protein
MGRRAKPTKRKGEGTRPLARKTPTGDSAKVRELEQRLAEALAQLQIRDRDLAEARDQQVATSEILRVISSSPTDVQPVFDTILSNALRLCDAHNGGVFTFDGRVFRLAAAAGVSDEFLAHLRESAIPPGPETPLRRVGLSSGLSHVADILADPTFSAPDTYRREGMRTLLAVPMLQHGRLIGALAFHRRVVRPFTDGQIALLQTFADQAVIAIENVRLFKELETRNIELTGALARQAATGEVLGAISQAQTDAQPVFEIIATSARRLCGAAYAQVQLFDGEQISLAAMDSSNPAADAAIRDVYPLRVGDGSAGGRAIARRAIAQIPDLLDDQAYRFAGVWGASGLRSLLAVPMLREGEPVGTIGIGRTEPGPFPQAQIGLLQTFADQAVIAIENVRLFTETKEALERQTATSEILRVISRSPTDVQPVFETIAERALRLCDGRECSVFRFDGELIHLMALADVSASWAGALRSAFPRPPGRGSMTARAILTRSIVHVPDCLTDPEYELTEAARASNNRSVLSVPMIREGEVVGAITVSREEPKPFTAKHIELVTTFADQAVIAIENVRLFTELQASNRELTTALDTQMATSDILRVISGLRTDVQPVFDAILASAARLLKSYSTGLTQAAGDRLHLAAFTNTDASGDAFMRAHFPLSLDSDDIHCQAVRDRAPVVVTDVEADLQLSEDSRAYGRARGWRSAAVVPMLRHGEALGSIGVSRREAGGFAADEIGLLQTFADQAVIAIENARLLTELQQRNRDVTEALEQQTATSEILKVIASSPTDLQPVFDTIVRSASRLCAADFSGAHLLDGDRITLEAHYNARPVVAEAIQRIFPMPLGRATAEGRAILSRVPVHITDVQADPEFTPQVSALEGHRTVVAVPMLREGIPIGAVVAWRREVRPFTDQQIEILQTFANQAVIAIENVRLFKELETRTAELQHSVGQLTALGEVGQAVSSSLDLATVLTTIVSRAVQLSGLDGGVVFEYDAEAETFVQRVAIGTANRATMAREGGVRRGEGVVGRTALTLRPVQIPDILVAGAYEGRIRADLVEAGVRALVAVPILREGRLIGGLVVNRNQPGIVSPDTVELLETFAAQSALAIENARLFREIEDKSRQLEVASQHKSEFLANMSHELRTPMNAILGFSEVLAEGMFGEINDKQAEYLRDILESGRHLLSLINDILDLSKIEAGRMELEPDDFDLPGAIDNALTLVRERAGRRGITLGREIDQQIGMIRGDERKVKQVVLNLLSNAIKFTPEGGRIDVRATMTDAMVEVSVTDTGVGIAPEDQETVFEEFRQVGTADKKVEGTGLGLALSRKFVGLHGGRIWVKSQVGQGSTFTFTLPVRREPSD